MGTCGQKVIHALTVAQVYPMLRINGRALGTYPRINGRAPWPLRLATIGLKGSLL